MNCLFPSVVVLFACVLSFDTMSQILQNVFKQLKKTVIMTVSSCVFLRPWETLKVLGAV